ncbi:hypothetical protein LINPERPRIM_LOCUS11247, partial [Linum perenne]
NRWLLYSPTPSPYLKVVRAFDDFEVPEESKHFTEEREPHISRRKPNSGALQFHLYGKRKPDLVPPPYHHSDERQSSDYHTYEHGG